MELATRQNSKNCECCGVSYTRKHNVSPSQFASRRFCGKSCGKRSVVVSTATKNKLRFQKLGNKNSMFGKVKESNPNWKGTDVSYNGIHRWIRKNYGELPKQCEVCGVLGKKNGNNWSIQWANISGLYLRVRPDWKQLCCKCHKQYDMSKKNQNG